MDGTTLNGRYTLGRLLGKGGMGAVYEADDVALQRRVAVKIISPEVAHGRSALGRFEREAKAASAIRTEHIVRVLDAGVSQETGAPFMVMELLRGEDLAQLLDRLGPLPPGLALRIVAQACVGLQQAHEAGVLHRDIKPANLFLARRDEGGGLVVKLLDFGVAKIRPSHDPRVDTTGLTRSGHMLGTPRYMSPEQARAIKDIDHRTDIWSLGVVLYRALAGRTPTEDVKAIGELIAALVADLPAPVQELAPWVSPEVAAVLDGALQYRPADRYPSASAMLDAIRPLLGDDPLSLDESMLVPLEPSERLTVARRFEPPVRARVPRLPRSHVAGAERWKDVPAGGVTAHAQGTTLGHDYRIPERPPSEPALTHESTVSQDYRVHVRPPSEPAPPRLPPRGLKMLPLSAVALLAAGLGWAAMPRVADAPTTAFSGVQRAIRGALEAPSVQSPAPSALARRIGPSIVPEEASVKIDGVPATLKGGKPRRPAAAASATPAAAPAPACTSNPLMPQQFE
ncbi:serine/threonine-protein kinase [Sorangium sp. So ce260]|uniref:serine/threonine-protein kinase n=1 Tax=Sorangium sp. So ce260 TaxID=3133291 RepID=UPI003F609BE9